MERLAPTRITSGRANDQLIYFTSPCVTADGGHLIFISDRTGHPNIFSLDQTTGEERQLSRNENGTLMSYQYFRGDRLEGLGKASISLHASSRTVYYLQDDKICSVDLDGNHRVLAEYPQDQATAYTHVSHDGTRICVATTDARALETDRFRGSMPVHDIDRRVQDEGLNSYLRVYDTSSGKEIVAEPVPRAWITHVQFCPTDRDLILYNHEWPCFHRGSRRMWTWNGVEHKRLRQPGEGRSSDDWVCHEMWSQDGESIIYHGQLGEGPHFLGRVALGDGAIVEIPMPDGFTEYGHFSVGRSGLLVSDGYYREGQGAERLKDLRGGVARYARRVPRGIKRLLPLRARMTIAEALGVNRDYGEWISVQRVDWRSRRIEWIPLCRHGSANCRGDQDSHPHPVFDNNDDGVVYFTANRDGLRGVYRVDIPPGLID